ncbi:MAG TPA: ATP-binding cassette domain-containing protein [Polyangiaceae bacterium]|nr:ATP-binding cassette domain-containing protein [Polyangiaceae bacterium]
MTALFRARGVTVRTAERTLLDGLDVELDRGDVLAIGGPSGAGKTTALRALAGLSVAEGTLELEGKPPEEHGWPLYRRRVGYLAQRPVVLDGTVQDNLALAFSFASADDARFDRDRAAELLEATLLTVDVLEQQARTLSEGERQRVGLVRTLLVEPVLLLLDEPTSALDPEATEAVEALVRAHVQRDGAAILVSHDAAQRDRLATRSIELGER